MVNLPEDNLLPIQFLSATFKKTSATYKYYWFLSFLQLLEEEGLRIEKRRIFSRMLSNAWYTVNYFKVSFGKQDKIQETISFFHRERGIPVDLNQNQVWNQILSLNDLKSISALSHFDNQVPHWFLSPWFPNLNKNQIYFYSRDPKRKSLYFLDQHHIEINPEWFQYLLKNSAILKSFCYWNLSLFLQKHNPNVPDIPNKLIKPINRSNLNKNKLEFWNLYFDEVNEHRCIYSNIPLTKENYVLDHFVPYNFVSHNLNWNLVPAHSSTNSSKSDKLPRLEQLFEPFFDIQKRSFEIVFKKAPKSWVIEEYLTIFPTIDGLLDETLGKLRFKETLQPLITIAHNNGFEYYGQE
ncbi:MAG: hypothetical protein KGZ90_07305 [Algoriphagus sp.]|nr:hypothetical protein [Algoriphagus sp.]